MSPQMHWAVNVTAAAYRSLISNPAVEWAKWVRWGDYQACRLCHAAGWHTTDRGSQRPNCEVCPLSGLKPEPDDEYSPAPCAEDTFMAMRTALDAFPKEDASEDEIVEFTPTDEDLDRLAEAAQLRLDWIMSMYDWAVSTEEKSDERGPRQPGAVASA